jgi:nicotinate-nucleotide adenylyltransferase
MERIGIYGGSFDPVHLGHVLVAAAAREELDLDRLILVPAAQSPFKPSRAPAPGPTRLRLLRLAFAGLPWAEVDDVELRRGGLSYTCETLEEYARRHPGVCLYYLIGADHVPQLPNWRNPGALAKLAEFLVIPRPGEPRTPFPPPFQGRWLEGFPLAVSSSQIRDRIRAGRPYAQLLPAPVAEVIANSGLYL